MTRDEDEARQSLVVQTFVILWMFVMTKLVT